MPLLVVSASLLTSLQPELTVGAFQSREGCQAVFFYKWFVTNSCKHACFPLRREDLEERVPPTFSLWRSLQLGHNVLFPWGLLLVRGICIFFSHHNAVDAASWVWWPANRRVLKRHWGPLDTPNAVQRDDRGLLNYNPCTPSSTFSGGVICNKVGGES